MEDEVRGSDAIGDPKTVRQLDKENSQASALSGLPEPGLLDKIIPDPLYAPK